MIRVKISSKKILELSKQNDDIRTSAGMPDAGGRNRYETPLEEKEDDLASSLDISFINFANKDSQ